MKTILFFALAGIFLLSGCDDDDNSPNITSEAQKAFSTKYPSATNISWENKNAYLIADFQNNAYSSSAWFDHSGRWYMTETDMTWAQLPEAVKTTFNTTEYAQWQLDDVDMLERNDAETLYIIEVEKGEQELDLYFSDAGIFIKAVTDGDNDHADLLPSGSSEKIKAEVLKMYPEARLVDFDTENGITEVTIIDGNRSKEVRFDALGQWIETEYDISNNEIPVKVMETLNTLFTAPYIIDDAECHETPNGVFFDMEIEKNNQETKVKIKEDGTILV